MADPCEQGVPPCGSTTDVHPYLTGWCCPLHTPGVVGGRPPLVVDPEWGAEAGYRLSGWRRSFIRETKIDEKHRASGKRASGNQRKASHAG